MRGGVGFITAHVVGSHNNFDPRNATSVAEYMARNTANVAWLKNGFTDFANANAIVVAIHADMFYETSGFTPGWGWSRHSPFAEFAITLTRASSDFAKPVLLLFGDSHVHRLFRPFPKYRPYLTAIEVYGFPDIRAIEIEVRPHHRQPFRVTHRFGEP